ncbi:sphingoid long-chain bases kinase 1-like isoform X2 [Magnolia sinica]|uniref:sphingoid long-chain bases kinase 1-like isoform X2 n=1 Tax=Magnolia sinica TaxID=86752 RepID=UPI0026584BE8|nr:sphingoid long-chain bases kinase 1-like isoform X2 [Magnolia sinica]
MQRPSYLLQNVKSLKVLLQHPLRRLSTRCSQIATGQHSSPVVFPEKRGKVKCSRQNEANVASEDPVKVKAHEHRIDIGDEQSDLLGYEILSGRLILDKRTPSSSTNVENVTETKNQDGIVAKLTSKAFIWGSHLLCLKEVISVSYTAGLRHFTVHAYPIRKRSCGLSCFLKPQRSRKDFHFLASNSVETLQWVSGFADQQCFVKCLPHPLVSSKKQGSDIASDFLPEQHIKCKSPPKILVILNPHSGRGRSSKVFHGKVEPIFELAGFSMKIVKTTSAGHARSLASNVDLSTCSDGIICVGGDGIVNEVLNGLLSRSDQKEAISIPIGIIPAGSDNSLVWTVLGVRDPVSAAIAIVKGGLTGTDVFAVEWIQNVLELSEKYQKRFGPLRYFVAGFLKFLCLPKYSFEVEYLPASTAESDPKGKVSVDCGRIDTSDIYTDIMRKLHTDGIPRASSLSSIDSIMTPSRMSGDLGKTCSMHASSEPSEYVRGLDPKTKRLSSGRNNAISEPEEVIHPQLPLSATPNWPRTRSKSRADKGSSGSTAMNDSRCSLGNMAVNDKEDISSTISDPGPIWDTEPKWDTEPTWEDENPIQLPGPPDDIEVGIPKEVIPDYEEKWVVKKGKFLGVLVCNHSCKTVQSLSSQVVAPKAEHDDNTLDLLLVHGSGRLRLLRFLLRLQFGQHLSLPYVEYVKVKSVKIKPSKSTHNSCGIDGELISTNGQVICSLLPEQCRLIGHSTNGHV